MSGAEKIGKNMYEAGGMKKICVNLYGGKGVFGGKESPLQADIIYCDRADECSFYKAGKCLECRMLFHRGCEFGKTEKVQGYTSKAAKYYDFKKKWQSDPLYNKCDFPAKRVGLLRDVLYLNLSYVNVRKYNPEIDKPYKTRIDGYVVDGPGLFGGPHYVFIPVDDLTDELLYKIITYVPYGGFEYQRMDAYQKEVVPDIALGLRSVVPDLWNRFVEKHPELDIAPNYVGKKAFINSLKPGTTFEDDKKRKWVYDGAYVRSLGEISIGFYSPWLMQDAEKTFVEFKVNEKMTFTVMDNGIVDDDTKFVE